VIAIIAAKRRGWIVINMKNDWKKMVAFDR
jgi:hypothetical protein